jgi:hypothetical protein
MVLTVALQTILREAAVRCNALVGPKPANLETTYNVSPLTAANFQSSIFPFTAFLDQETASIARFSNAIAETGNHPWRSFVGLSVTAPLASGDVIPSVDVNGDPIIGLYGSVLDNDDQTIICTEYPEQAIRRRNLNPSLWVIPVYGFKMSGDGITHTRPNGVVVQVCTFNWNTVYQSVVNNGNLTLPDSLANAIVYDMVANLIRDDEFIPQAQVYRAAADQVEMNIRKGLASVSEQVIAGPTLVGA